MSDPKMGVNDPTFYGRHLRDEVLSAHRALDEHNAPTTKRVPRRNGHGEHDITISLAERIHALVVMVKHGK